MKHNQRVADHAHKAFRHYQRVLLGDGLTRTDREMFRTFLVHFYFRWAQALERIERAEEIAA